MFFFYIMKVRPVLRHVMVTRTGTNSKKPYSVAETNWKKSMHKMFESLSSNNTMARFS